VNVLDNDPLWYKDAVLYELHVRAFHDSVGDGRGDFRGLTQKLDYLQDLGVTAIWLLPFYPSPQKDDGYDIADYTAIHAHYGVLADFREVLAAAHQRGLRVITELVINHTSDQHPWFQRARRAPPGSPERDFYVWSDTPDKYKEARVIFKDFEQSNWAWDPVAKAYYWHRFYSHQPDLNYDNPAVWNAIFPVVDFWLGMGVDGMRLDAVPYLYEREGTNCENLPETHAFLKALRRHMDEKFANRMLLAEANQWPEDAVAYFGSGDEAHMAFHFPLMPRLFMAIHMEDRFPVLDIMAQTPPIAETCQWGLFLRNHDELTLEMVTDEERDYMYRAYANDPQARINLGIRHRLAPLLGNNRRRIELMNGLLFSLPGTPVLYYGDEIGMGDNIYLGDRNGVRTPMQWSSDRNAGFSRGNPQKLYLPVIIDPEYHFEAVNVEAQQNNPNSLLWFMKRLIALRKRHKAFGRGRLEFLHPANRKVLAFLRRYSPHVDPSTEGRGLADGEEVILVVANLSRFVNHAEMDLSQFEGLVPVELFSRNAFPPIGKLPYLFTFGPHTLYWFSLERQPVRGPVRLSPRTETEIPTLHVSVTWEELFRSLGKDRLEEVLPAYLGERPWFGSGSHRPKSVALQESFRLQYSGAVAYITLVDVEFDDGAGERYLVPLSLAEGAQAEQLLQSRPSPVVARLQGATIGVLFDAFDQPDFCRAMVAAIETGKVYNLGDGEVVASAFPAYQDLAGSAAEAAASFAKTEDRNTCLVLDNRFLLKVFRRVEEGTNPDLEIGRYLTEKKHFPQTPPILGAIEFRPRRGEPRTLAVLHGFVPHESNAWQYTLDELSRFFERVLALPDSARHVLLEACHVLALATQERPSAAQEMIDTYLDLATVLGQRTAELHRALTEDADDPAFLPEPFTTLYQRSLYQSMRSLKRQTFEKLRQRLPDLPEEARPLAERALDNAEPLHRRLHAVLQRKLQAQRTRYHGDYHLGHVLLTGKDVMIIDFEGELSRSITERRLKRSPLRDVASMVRSFHYAAYMALLGHGTRRGHSPGVIRPEDLGVLEPWTRFWCTWVSAAFLRGYLNQAAAAPFLPSPPQDLKVLFDAFLLEEAIQELAYELTHRLDRVIIPLRGITDVLEWQG
jgi:maltose alpha-D-glucosyltransferase/alpha-amylase